MPAATRLEISLLGTFSLRLGSTEIRMPGRKACALIGYLALADAHESTREALLALLWSESSEGKARASLRQVVHEVHGAFLDAGFAGFHSDRLILRLSPETISVDMLEALRLAKDGHAHPKLFFKQRAMESLLRDLETTDREYREWLTAKRQTLHEQIVDRLASSCRTSAQGSNRLELSRAILNLDPTHEEAARNIMRAQAALGDASGALRVYKNLWVTLENEFDIEPAKETQELVVSIKLGQPVAVAALETPRTIVVAQSAQTARTAQGRTRAAEQLEAAVRNLVGPYGGRLSAREDNTYVLDFPDPRAAVQAALSINDLRGDADQRTAQPALRMGAHVSGALGEGRASAKEVADQLATLAEPGELLVSDQVRDVLTDGLDALIEDTSGREPQGPLSLHAYRVSAPTRQQSSLQEGNIHPVLAIIPFELVSKQAKHLLVGEVMAEEMIASFCATKELAVISRLSTRAFRGRSSSLEELRQRLQANYVLSGSYNVRGNNVELQAELTDARSETVLWRREFKESISAILNGSAELVGEMVASISASVLTRELDRARSRPLETLENYSLLMAAINLSHRTSLGSFGQARGLLELLAERLPAHPLPLAWLAKWHVFKVNQGWSEDRASDSQHALDCATRAIESDPACSIALTVNAWANLSLRKRFDVADEFFERAVEANPNDSTAWLLKGTMHAFKGEGRTAVTAAQRAIHLSPLDPRRSYYDSLAAAAYLSAGDFERSIQLAQQSLRVDRQHLSTLRALTVAQFLSGREEEARRTMVELLRLEPTLTVSKYLSRHPAAELATGKLWAETLGAAGLPR